MMKPQIHIRATDTLRERLDHIADVENCTLSALVRDALHVYTENWRRFHDLPPRNSADRRPSS